AADRARAARLFRPAAWPAARGGRRACSHARPGARSRALLRTALRGALDRRTPAPLDRARHAPRPGGPGPRRTDRRPRRPRLPLPAGLRARRARSRKGGGVLHPLPRRGRAALRSHRPPAPGAPPARGDAGQPARRRRRRPQPGGGLPASGGRCRRGVGPRGAGAVKLREVALVAGKELRETLRDRRTLAVMVLFPLVIYPLVSLVTAQVLAARV